MTAVLLLGLFVLAIAVILLLLPPARDDLLRDPHKPRFRRTRRKPMLPRR